MLALVSLGAGVAQNQSPTLFVRDYCVKVADGKDGEYAAFARDVTAKVQQARVDSGEAAWGLIARVVTPSGSTSRCDYHIVYGFEGKLPEPAGPASLDAALKAAAINMTAAEMTARRNSLSKLVSQEVMRRVDAVQTEFPTKGAYVRLNHYRIKPGQPTSAWVDIERDTWKVLVTAAVADGMKTSWGAYVITQPQGDMVWSNAFTADVYPSWDALMQGMPLAQLWSKVFPNRSRSEWSDRLATIADRRLVEIAQIVATTTPKNSASGGSQE